MEDVRAPARRGGFLARLPFVSADRRGPESAEELFRLVGSYLPKGEVRLVQRAYEFAENSHRGQLRASGEPFIEHPLGVAAILGELGMDGTTLVASLLHDVVEDTDLGLEDVEREFGAEVATIVDGLTKLDKIQYRSREAEQAENVRKMMVAMARDIRVLIIKLADRLHNMRTLGSVARAKQVQKATETLEIYGPLSHRLGIYSVKWELEDLSFATLHPKQYEEIQNLVGKAESERAAYLQQVVEGVEDRLRRSKIKAAVQGRPKHLYGVYEKMVLRGKEFSEIYDLVGIRIQVDTVKDCYAALGALHSLWKPVPGRFKDYIAMPKFNMYQSLHTTVIGPEGRPLEVQIRTHQMHRTAEFGVAAHWRYKEGKGKEDPADLAWLAQMLEWQKETSDPREFMEGLKIDLYAGRVFCFTPKGDVVDLPLDSVPIDFAYAIHTEVGHRCIGAKVNGKLVPLDYRLQTGDTVVVLTTKAKDAGPSRDWLRIVKSPRARNKIRQWFSRERREDAIDTGRELVQRELRRQGLPLKRLTTEDTLAAVARELKYPSLDAFLAAVGEGQVSPQSVVTRLSRLVAQEAEEEEEAADVPPARPVRLGPRTADQAVVVQGSSDVWVKLARCCTPVPGDEIVGFVTRGKGVSVHRADCPNARALSKGSDGSDRFIEVSWQPGRGTSFVVSIQVEALDRKKLLGDVATAISEQQVNILSASSTVGRDRIARLRFTFELADIAHLSSVLSAVKKLDSVFDAFRVVPG